MAKKDTSTKIKVNRLKVILAERDITHKDLAERLGKTPNTITRICNNETQPSLLFLRDIAIELNIDIRDLLVPTEIIK